MYCKGTIPKGISLALIKVNVFSFLRVSCKLSRPTGLIKKDEKGEDYDEDGPFSIHNRPVDAEPIHQDILKCLESYLNNIHELVNQDFAIRSTVIKIKQALSLPEHLQGDEYSITKNKLFQYIRKLINGKYGNIRSIL